MRSRPASNRVMATTGVPKTITRLVIVRPGEERKPKPSHPGRAHRVNGDDEVETSENRGEPINEDAEDCWRHRGIRIDAAERSVKRPAGVQPAGAEGI